MKTEEEIAGFLEDIVARFHANLPPELVKMFGGVENLCLERRIKTAFLAGSICTLAWVLDSIDAVKILQEEEVKK